MSYEFLAGHLGVVLARLLRLFFYCVNKKMTSNVL